MASHKNHQQKEFKHLREVVKWLHGNKCYICKHKFEVLEVHHINKKSTDHRLENLIPVCKEHHIFLGKMATLKQLTRIQILQMLEVKKQHFNAHLF